jgi:hypothetical protein
MLKTSGECFNAGSAFLPAATTSDE